MPQRDSRPGHKNRARGGPRCGHVYSQVWWLNTDPHHLGRGARGRRKLHTPEVSSLLCLAFNSDESAEEVGLQQQLRRPHRLSSRAIHFLRGGIISELRHSVLDHLPWREHLSLISLSAFAEAGGRGKNWWIQRRGVLSINMFFVCGSDTTQNNFGVANGSSVLYPTRFTDVVVCLYKNWRAYKLAKGMCCVSALRLSIFQFIFILIQNNNIFACLFVATWTERNRYSCCVFLENL